MSEKQTKPITVEEATNRYKEILLKLATNNAKWLFEIYKIFGGVLEGLKAIIDFNKDNKEISDRLSNLNTLMANSEKQFSAYFTAHMLTYSFDSKGIEILEQGNKMVLEFIENFKKYYTKVLCDPKLLNEAKA